MEDVPVFCDDELLHIVAHLRRSLEAGADVVSFRVLDPDHGAGLHSGEFVTIDGLRFRHRPLRVWLELADRLRLRLRTPRADEHPTLRLSFERLQHDAARTPRSEGLATERYGTDSPFARIRKSEEAGFLLDLVDALERVALAPDARVLDLGVGRGDELALLEALVGGFADKGRFVGVDHSASALDVARARFDSPRHRFVQASLDDIAELELGRFDLVLSIATLQSPSVDDRELLRRIVKDHLEPSGSLILGLPNCAYVDGEVMAGARQKNYRQAELGLLIKDAAHYRRYLQQHRRKVYVTGTHELLLTAVPE